MFSCDSFSYATWTILLWVAGSHVPVLWCLLFWFQERKNESSTPGSAVLFIMVLAREGSWLFLHFGHTRIIWFLWWWRFNYNGWWNVLLAGTKKEEESACVCIWTWTSNLNNILRTGTLKLEESMIDEDSRIFNTFPRARHLSFSAKTHRPG